MPLFILYCSNNIYIKLISLYILQFHSYMKFEIFYIYSYMPLFKFFLDVIYLLLENKIIYLLMLPALDQLLRLYFSPKSQKLNFHILFVYYATFFILYCSNNIYIKLMSLYILQFHSYMKFEIFYIYSYMPLFKFFGCYLSVA